MINLAYLTASVLFIFGLKGLTHPRTAVRGNLLGATGMIVAIVATLLDRRILSYEFILLGLFIGAAVGAVLALKIQMAAMPQMVAALNGFGGAASALVAGAALIETSAVGQTINTNLSQQTAAAVVSGIIGAIAFWGSMVAFGKLQGIITENAVRIPAQHFVNGGVLLGALGLGVWLVQNPSLTMLYWGVVALASIAGLLLVLPIGGADMPVVIALLNSYSGLAAAATGFVLNNTALMITGALVGASGLILTNIMCRAMNRSLSNVLFAVWVPATAESSEDIYTGRVKSASADEVAMLLDTARRVVIVPGYGMAVAQAQHAVSDLTDLLELHGSHVDFAVHPVAGRMPGHMNVLLAEADIPYEKLREMDDINPTFEQTDVAIIIGANDVVNPLARTDPSSPIAGMPILDVDKARSVIVIKRSLSPGFAGIANPLFAAPNTLMMFADAKQAVVDLVGAMKNGH